MSFPVKTKSRESSSTVNVTTHFAPSLPLTTPIVPIQRPSVITTLHQSTSCHSTRYLGWIKICQVRACLTTLTMILPSWGCNACSSVSTVFAGFPSYSHSEGSPDAWIVNWICLYLIILWILPENSQWPAILEWVWCDTVFFTVLPWLPYSGVDDWGGIVSKSGDGVRWEDREHGFDQVDSTSFGLDNVIMSAPHQTAYMMTYMSIISIILMDCIRDKAPLKPSTSAVMMAFPTNLIFA